MHTLRSYQVIKCEMCGSVIHGEPHRARVGKVEYVFCSKRCAGLYRERQKTKEAKFPEVVAI